MTANSAPAQNFEQHCAQLYRMEFPVKKKYLFIASIGAALITFSAGHAQTTTASPKQPDKKAIAAENARQLLSLMDTDKNGKISKAEWIKFMSDEFDRLDTDHSGELDPKELLQSQVSSTRHVTPAVQGK
jgi:CRISPR/Cas system-associated endonuclease Cas3-HD